MSLWKNWLEILKDPGRDPYERRYRLITPITIGFLFLYICVSLFTGSNQRRLVVFTTGSILYTVLYPLAVRFKKTQLHAIGTALVLIFFVMTRAFIRFGGIQSGAPYWCLLTAVYIIATVRGRTKNVLIACDLLTAGACFLYTYLHPETVMPLTTKEAYLNAVSQLSANLFFMGSMFFFQFYMARQERAILKAQQDEIDVLNIRQDDLRSRKTGTEDSVTVHNGKKTRFQIAVDSGSDLPPSWIRHFGIAVINNYVDTDQGRFEDSEEIQTCAVLRYLENSSHYAHSDSAPVEEFRDFFARLLTQAEHVVFISLGKGASRSYERALLAAKMVQPVTVIDSGQLSSAAGMLAVYAAHLSETERNPDIFFAKVERFRERIRCSVLFDSTENMVRNGRMGAGTHRMLRAFLIRPVITAKRGAIAIKRLFIGNAARTRERYIAGELRDKDRIDGSLLILPYAGLQEKELAEIREEVRKRMTFDRIVFRELSSSIAGNAGSGALGFVYCLKDIREKAGAFSFLPEELTKENGE